MTREEKQRILQTNAQQKKYRDDPEASQSSAARKDAFRREKGIKTKSKNSPNERKYIVVGRGKDAVVGYLETDPESQTPLMENYDKVNRV